MGSIHLIRHGQASWGAEDYDQLSPAGFEQSVALADAWQAGRWAPTAAIAGAMRRHEQTATATLEHTGLGYEIDKGWNEFDHLALADMIEPDAHRGDPSAFQEVLNDAITRWMAGELTGGETYAQFQHRVLEAHAAAVERAWKGQRVAVFTSGGPIAMVVSQLLTGSDELFTRLNDVVVNASMTTVISGRSGVRLLAFNEHAHLPGSLVTWR